MSMRRYTDAATKIIVLDWKSEGKRPRGCPRKRRMDVVEKDLEDLGAQNGRVLVQDRDEWFDLVTAAKTLWKPDDDDAAVWTRRRQFDRFCHAVIRHWPVDRRIEMTTEKVIGTGLNVWKRHAPIQWRNIFSSYCRSLSIVLYNIIVHFISVTLRHENC